MEERADFTCNRTMVMSFQMRSVWRRRQKEIFREGEEMLREWKRDIVVIVFEKSKKWKQRQNTVMGQYKHKIQWKYKARTIHRNARKTHKTLELLVGISETHAQTDKRETRNYNGIEEQSRAEPPHKMAWQKSPSNDRAHKWSQPSRNLSHFIHKMHSHNNAWQCNELHYHYTNPREKKCTQNSLVLCSTWHRNDRSFSLKLQYFLRFPSQSLSLCLSLSL